MGAPAAENFAHCPALFYVRYRSALNSCWAVVAIAWIAWCLYWPFFARGQDERALQVEAAETYKVCLQQKGVTAADCAVDRGAYTKLNRRWAAPPDENVYQAFAGKKLPDALSFFLVLCLFPVVTGYGVLRTVLEALLRISR